MTNKTEEAKTVIIKEVKTKHDQKAFLEFPNKLYKGNPYYVPPLYIDEIKMFRDDYVYYDTCEAVYYIAECNGETVGRISGILQKAANQKYNQKRIRFTRFDTIDDSDVSKALFEAVENWGREKGMEEICGPLGFSDFEREGLLIEGFDQLSTFEEQYNYEYYQKHIETLGFEKEVDWYESKIRPVPEGDKSLQEMSDYVMKRYNLHWVQPKSTKDMLNRYADKFFELVDSSYELIYGTVPFTDNMKKMMIDNFNLIIKMKYVGLIADENDELVCFGISFPSLAKTMQKAGGHLRPSVLFELLKAQYKPEILDLGLIGVKPEYLNRGISSCIAANLDKLLKTDTNIDHCETNLNLENNAAIRNLWKRFDSEQHKKRRCYVKSL